MTTSPTWAATDHDTASLLDLLADTEAAIPEPERQWQHFLSVLRRLIRRAGWNHSTDTTSRNRGKPQNTWEWLGT